MVLAAKPRVYGGGLPMPFQVVRVANGKFHRCPLIFFFPFNESYHGSRETHSKYRANDGQWALCDLIVQVDVLPRHPPCYANSYEGDRGTLASEALQRIQHGSFVDQLRALTLHIATRSWVCRPSHAHRHHYAHSV